MNTPLVPQVFYFRLAAPCRRVDTTPARSGRRMLELPPECQLPATGPLDGRPAWGEVRAAWNPSGLGFVVEATGSLDALGAVDLPETFTGMRLWIDTRDTRDVSRATRYCHRFDARLEREGRGRGLGVTIAQKPIARAIAEPPVSRGQHIQARAGTTTQGWRLEIFLGAEALHGFDPDTNRRLGFTYQLCSPGNDDQFLGVGREFPLGENPSLWSTLELRDP